MEEEDWLVDSSCESDVEKSTTESSSMVADGGGWKHVAIVECYKDDENINGKWRLKEKKVTAGKRRLNQQRTIAA